MCGVTLTRNPGAIQKIAYRGIEVNEVEVGDWILGHTRLPIQTLEGDKWGQPIELGEGKSLLYNGEIFNYDKNRYENDVDYLVQFFRKNGENFSSSALKEMNQWDGFWAIVIFSPNKVFAFTDPLGKKQLYYNENHEIASEAKAILPEFPALDEKTISTISKWGYNTDDRTCFEGVRRIMPGKIYQFRKPGDWISQLSYFDWGKVSLLETDTIYNLLHESVESRMISKKYPIGLLLSSGLDSTIILSCLKNLGHNPSCYYIENGEDEFIEIVEDYFDLSSKRIKMPERSQEISEALWFNESPIDLGSTVAQHKIFSVIPEKIVLSGDGADELFRGYRRNAEYDSQQSDIFDELSFYHLPRLDKASMRYTIELRNPFLSHKIVSYALKYGKTDPSIDKKILKKSFQGSIPVEILNRSKTPLKRPEIINNPTKDRLKLIKIFRGLYE